MHTLMENMLGHPLSMPFLDGPAKLPSCPPCPALMPFCCSQANIPDLLTAKMIHIQHQSLRYIIIVGPGAQDTLASWQRLPPEVTARLPLVAAPYTHGCSKPEPRFSLWLTEQA